MTNEIPEKDDASVAAETAKRLADFRTRIAAGEDIPQEELLSALRLYRSWRGAAAGAAQARKETKAVKKAGETVISPQLLSLFADLEKK